MQDARAKRWRRTAAVVPLAMIVAGCGWRQAAPSAGDARGDAPHGPAIIARLHVPLERVARISRFRSGVGHDYSDGVERCRSMKHYFQFTGGEPGRAHEPSWTTVPIVSPLDGAVVGIDGEWAGDQVRIRSALDRRYTVVLFHVRRNADVVAGIHVEPGRALGWHASDETMSDLAVEVDEPSAPHGRRLVSAFDVMGDAAFAALTARGVASRATLVAARAERDADALRCDGERFTSGSRLADWVTLSMPTDPRRGATPSP